MKENLLSRDLKNWAENHCNVGLAAITLQMLDRNLDLRDLCFVVASEPERYKGCSIKSDTLDDIELLDLPKKTFKILLELSGKKREVPEVT